MKPTATARRKGSARAMDTPNNAPNTAPNNAPNTTFSTASTSSTSTSAGDVAGMLTKRLNSPWRIGVPATVFGVLVGALAWPDPPATAWGLAIVAIVACLAFLMMSGSDDLSRPSPNNTELTSSLIDSSAVIATLFVGRSLGRGLNDWFGVPAPVAAAIVAVAAAATLWLTYRRPRSTVAPRAQPLPDGFPADSTAPADRILAVLHVAGAAAGRRIVFADRLADLTVLSDADAATTLTELKGNGAVTVRRNLSALTAGQRRRDMVELADGGGRLRGEGSQTAGR